MNDPLPAGEYPLIPGRLMGVVLCGGESRRMGRDKGSLLKEGVPWGRRMADKLAPFAIPVVFSVNQRQFEIYSALIPAGQFVPDAPGNTLPVTGPLKGLLSVHQQFPSNDLLLLACDMLDLDGPTIGKMIAAYRASACGHTKSMDHGERNDRGVHDFFVYQGAKFAQPFCGIYTSGGLAPAYARALQAGSRDFSLQSLLNGGKTKRIPIDRMEAFENYNAL